MLLNPEIIMTGSAGTDLRGVAPAAHFGAGADLAYPAMASRHYPIGSGIVHRKLLTID